MSRVSPERRFRSLLAGLFLLTAACGDGPIGVRPGRAIPLALPWQSVPPDSVGMDATKLATAATRAGEIERVRSLLVVRRGRLVLERYYGGTDSETLADVRSVTESIVSTLTGIALQRGDITSLDQSIGDFLKPPGYALDSEHHSVTIRHLLTMTAGFFWDDSSTTGYDDWITSADHVGYILDRPLLNPPGDTFTHSSAAIHLLGVVLERATGRTLPDYADEVLFGPLGIDERVWEELSSGGVNGGAGIDLRPRDLARFGQLFLQEGWSGAESVVPAEWVVEATARRFDWTVTAGPIAAVSYGFLWWIDIDNDAFFAWGFGGQFVYVVPRLDLVVVATTDWRGVRDDIGPDALQEAVLAVIVNRVLPAVR